MKLLSKILPLSLYLLLTVAAAVAGPKREETLFLFENRKVSVAVPAGFTYAMAKDQMGLFGVQLTAPEDKVLMHVLFVPDPEGQFANARTRKERMVELFEEYVETSVEKGMQFQELEPRTGVGTYCSFTDSTLVGKEKPAANEFLNVTAGVKVWPGVIAIFRIFSHDLKSNEYKAAMKVLRESVEEKSVPLR